MADMLIELKSLDKEDVMSIMDGTWMQIKKGTS